MRNVLKKISSQYSDLKSKEVGGFTIIEVMIVLAIAGLIMVIVFLAVPQLQRSQRDNSRQNISTRVKSELESYAANNQGNYPFAGGGACNPTNTGYTPKSWQDFYCRYIANPQAPNGGTKFVNDVDPTSGNSVFGATPSTYNPKAYSGGITLPASGAADVIYGAKCQGESVIASGSAVVTTRSYAFIIGLDRSNTYFCIDNG